jgi:hypothetical protein
MRILTPIATLMTAAAVVGCAPSPATTSVAPANASPSRAIEPAPRNGDTADFGLLVMAHGGDEEWNRSVEAEVAELQRVLPVELAFGMANPRTLDAAVTGLESRGVARAAVVRLFLSGASFRAQTDWYLGMAESPPEEFILMGPAASDPGARRAIEHEIEFVTHHHGLLDTKLAEDILVERARTLSEAPERESVIIVAHGMGDDGEDHDVLAALDPIAEAIGGLGFARVEAATLREDWAEKRTVAEARIREFVESETRADRRVLVIPARLSGFGPYADVLDGLDYVPGEGLLPHPDLSDWILRTGYALGCGLGWVGSEACEH